MAENNRVLEMGSRDAGLKELDYIPYL